MIISEDLRREIKDIFREVIAEELPDILRPAYSSGPLNIEKAAEFLSRSKASVYGLVHTNKIPFHKRGKRLYFLLSELEEWVKDGNNN